MWQTVRRITNEIFGVKGLTHYLFICDPLILVIRSPSCSQTWLIACAKRTCMLELQKFSWKQILRDGNAQGHGNYLGVRGTGLIVWVYSPRK